MFSGLKPSDNSAYQYRNAFSEKSLHFRMDPGRHPRVGGRVRELVVGPVTNTWQRCRGFCLQRASKCQNLVPNGRDTRIPPKSHCGNDNRRLRLSSKPYILGVISPGLPRPLAHSPECRSEWSPRISKQHWTLFRFHSGKRLRHPAGVNSSRRAGTRKESRKDRRIV